MKMFFTKISLGILLVSTAFVGQAMAFKGSLKEMAAEACAVPLPESTAGECVALKTACQQEFIGCVKSAAQKKSKFDCYFNGTNADHIVCTDFHDTPECKTNLVNGMCPDNQWSVKWHYFEKEEIQDCRQDAKSFSIALNIACEAKPPVPQNFPAGCGNNVREGQEVCDGKDTPADSVCSKDCTFIMTISSGVETCGNGILDAGEKCDVGVFENPNVPEGTQCHECTSYSLPAEQDIVTDKTQDSEQDPIQANDPVEKILDAQASGSSCSLAAIPGSLDLTWIIWILLSSTLWCRKRN